MSSGSLTRVSAKPGHEVNGLSDSAQATSCAVGFDGGVGYRPGTGARETGRTSRAGSVDDSRQRIAAAVRRSGTKSRLGGNFSSWQFFKSLQPVKNERNKCASEQVNKRQIVKTDLSAVSPPPPLPPLSYSILFICFPAYKWEPGI